MSAQTETEKSTEKWRKVLQNIDYNKWSVELAGGFESNL
jgi:hypothetical protein